MFKKLLNNSISNSYRADVVRKINKKSSGLHSLAMSHLNKFQFKFCKFVLHNHHDFVSRGGEAVA